MAAHTSSQKSPVVNFWNIRKEQLAAARAALTKALAKEIPPERQSEHVSSSSESIPSQSTEPSVMNLGSSSISAHNTSHAMINGVTSMEHEEEHDPFIVRTNVKITRSSKPLLPSVHDTDTWPEVGKTAASNRLVANTVAIHLDDATRNKAEADPISTSVSRKSASLSYRLLSYSLLFESVTYVTFVPRSMRYHSCQPLLISFFEPQMKKLNGCP